MCVFIIYLLPDWQMSSVMFSVVLFVCLWVTLELETDCDEILLGGGEGPGW